MRWGLQAILAFMALQAFGFVALYGHNFPWADEWEFIPALTRHEPVLPWLWTQHNEHRLPLPRLIYWCLYQTTGDFRSGMVLQVALLTLLAGRLMHVAARWRGRRSWADAFFPVLLLHPGHAENFLMGYQLCFVLVTVLSCELFLQIDKPLRALGLTAMLVLCGGAGLVYVPFVVLWNLFRPGIGVRSFLGLILFAYILLYFQDYTRPAHHPPPSKPLRAMLITGQVLAMSVGYAAANVWPVVALGVLALGIVTIVQTVKERAWGRLIVILAGGSTAIAIGIGRSGFDSDTMGLWSRYGLLSAPLLVFAFLTLQRLQTVLAIIVIGFLPFNLATGIGWGQSLDEHLSAFERDSHRDPAEVVPKYLAGSGQEERAMVGLPMLKK
jgi:hypothetical protein